LTSTGKFHIQIPMTELRQELRSFIVDHFLFGDSGKLEDNASLLEGGVVDSTGVLELVTHLENAYGFKVADDELIPDNLDSIESLAQFVARKRASQPGAGTA
jgi:acyl carrier protein